MKERRAFIALGVAILAVAIVGVLIVARAGSGRVMSAMGLGPTTSAGRTAGPAANVRRFDGWALSCGADSGNVKRCALALRVFSRDKDGKVGGMLMSLAVTRGPRGAALLLITIPPSAQVAGGVTIQPDSGQALRAGFQNCSAQFCRAIFPLNNDLTKALSSAQSTAIHYVRANGQPVDHRIPTKGFDKGYAAWETDYPAPENTAAAAPPVPANAGTPPVTNR